MYVKICIKKINARSCLIFWYQKEEFSRGKSEGWAKKEVGDLTDHVAVTSMKNSACAAGITKPTVGPDSNDGRVMWDHREKEMDQSDAALIRLTLQQEACPDRRGEEVVQ